VTVRVKCFSIVKSVFECDEIEVDVAGGATAGDVIARVQAMAEGRLDGLPMRLARNHAFVVDGETVGVDDELALIPPVQGG
jgi:molybdopterin converting factor small subunit